MFVQFPKVEWLEAIKSPQCTEYYAQFMSGFWKTLEKDAKIMSKVTM